MIAAAFPSRLVDPPAKDGTTGTESVQEKPHSCPWIPPIPRLAPREPRTFYLLQKTCWERAPHSCPRHPHERLAVVVDRMLQFEVVRSEISTSQCISSAIQMAGAQSTVDILLRGNLE